MGNDLARLEGRPRPHLLGFFEDRIFSVAAGVSFYLLLALVPGISVLVTLYGFVADPRHLSGQLQPVLNVLPAAGAAIVVEQVTRLAEKSANALSLYLLVSLSIAGWSANAGIKAMFDALNVIYDEQKSAPSSGSISCR